MDELRCKLDHIHYVNNLWHISLELKDSKVSVFYKNRKTALQNAVINKYRDDVQLTYDDVASSQSEKEIYSIEFNKIKANACHIPKEDLEPEILKELLK